MSRRIAAVAAIALASTGVAQIWTRDPNFMPTLRNDAPASNLAYVPAADGRTLIYGRFTHLQKGNLAAQSVAFLRADDNVDGSFNSGLSSTANVWSAVPLVDGRVLVFDWDTGQTTAIRRLQADGSMDSTYAPITSWGVRFTPMADGHIIVWNSYLTLNGVDRQGIARLNADGTLDSTFTPHLPAGSTAVGSVVGQSNGKLIVGIWIPSPTPKLQVLRLNADGSADPTFATYSAPSNLSILAGQPDGKILAGTATTLIRLNTDGSVDSSFSLGIPSLHTLEHALVRSDGQIIVQAQVGSGAGPWPSTVLFLSAAGAVQRDLLSTLGEDRTLGLAGIKSDGSLLIVNGLATLGIGGTTIQPDVAPFPVVVPTTSVVTTPSGGQTAPLPPPVKTPADAGSTPTITNVILSPAVVAWRPVLSRVTADGSSASVIDFGPIVRGSGNVYSIVTDSSSRPVITGQFTTVDGQVRGGLARFTAAGALDTTFVPDVGDNNGVQLMLFSPDGGALVGVSTLGDRAPDGLYRTTTKVIKLRADGSNDTGFSPPAEYGAHTSWWAIGADGSVLVSHFSPDNTAAANLHLVWLDPSGKPATPLPTQFSGLGALISITIGGTPIPAASATSPGGPSSTPGIYGDPFRIVQPLSNGQILVGGGFTGVNGTNVAIGQWVGLARLNADGSLDGAYKPDLSSLIKGASAYVSLISADSSGRAVVAGSVWADGQMRNTQIRLLANGSVDPTYQHYSGPPPPYTSPLWTDFGLPDLNFPKSLPQSDGSVVSINYAVRAADGTVWTANPLAHFTASDVASITVPPADETVRAGHDAVFFVGIGTRQSATYQWYFNGQPIAGATLPFLVVPRVRPAQAGNYHVVVTIGSQTFTSTNATLTVAGGRARIVNFSALNAVDPGVTPIAGFGISSDGAARTWLIRGMGPALGNFGVSAPLPDPGIVLFSGMQKIAEDHGGALSPPVASLASQVGAFPAFRPPFYFPDFQSSESGLVPNLGSGSYTVHLGSTSNKTGTAMVEVYDSIVGGASGSLCNLSLRTQIRPGAPVATLGFTIAGDSAINVLVRGVGPALTGFGVAAPLANPQCSVYQQSSSGSMLIATNSGWGDNADLAAAAQATGAFPLQTGSRDAALLITLDPGSYTVQATSTGGSSGDALIEVYVVPPPN